MGAHRHGKVAVDAPFLRSRCDGRCLCRAVGMIWMEMALRLQQPHLCSSQYTDKGDEGHGDLVSGKAGTYDGGLDGFQELHSLYVGSAILQFVQSDLRGK